jgi:hypothetical protein
MPESDSLVLWDTAAVISPDAPGNPGGSGEPQCGDELGGGLRCRSPAARDPEYVQSMYRAVAAASVQAARPSVSAALLMTASANTLMLAGVSLLPLPRPSDGQCAQVVHGEAPPQGSAAG